MRRGFTLIELLIVVAIVAIISASLAFSFTQIVVRSFMAERRFRMDEAIATFADAIAGDVAQSASHEAIGASTLRLGLSGGARTVEYRIEPARLVRAIRGGPEPFEQSLVAETLSGEFAVHADGVSIELSAGFTLGARAVRRDLRLFAAWPQAVGEDAR